MVRDQLEAGTIHLSRALCILCYQLLPKRVLDPKVYVALPISFFWRGRHIGNGTFIYISDLVTSSSNESQKLAKIGHTVVCHLTCIKLAWGSQQSHRCRKSREGNNGSREHFSLDQPVVRSLFTLSIAQL